ncbi:hypothetical protein DFH09DRAFT_1369604 [Mycena vulgaris]|nr:hypothetical protein DFH09DRAFT_1369604 [Mycena vulgaris]
MSLRARRPVCGSTPTHPLALDATSSLGAASLQMPPRPLVLRAPHSQLHTHPAAETKTKHSAPDAHLPLPAHALSPHPSRKKSSSLLAPPTFPPRTPCARAALADKVRSHPAAAPPSADFEGQCTTARASETLALAMHPALGVRVSHSRIPHPASRIPPPRRRPGSASGHTTASTPPPPRPASASRTQPPHPRTLSLAQRPRIPLLALDVGILVFTCTSPWKLEAYPRAYWHGSAPRIGLASPRWIRGRGWGGGEPSGSSRRNSNEGERAHRPRAARPSVRGGSLARRSGRGACAGPHSAAALDSRAASIFGGSRKEARRTDASRGEEECVMQGNARQGLASIDALPRGAGDSGAEEEAQRGGEEAVVRLSHDGEWGVHIEQHWRDPRCRAHNDSVHRGPPRFSSRARAGLHRSQPAHGDPGARGVWWVVASACTRTRIGLADWEKRRRRRGGEGVVGFEVEARARCADLPMGRPRGLSPSLCAPRPARNPAPSPPEHTARSPSAGTICLGTFHADDDHHRIRLIAEIIAHILQCAIITPVLSLRKTKPSKTTGGGSSRAAADLACWDLTPNLRLAQAPHARSRPPRATVPAAVHDTKTKGRSAPDAHRPLPLTPPHLALAARTALRSSLCALVSRIRGAGLVAHRAAPQRASHHHRVPLPHPAPSPRIPRILPFAERPHIPLVALDVLILAFAGTSPWQLKSYTRAHWHRSAARAAHVPSLRTRSAAHPAHDPTREVRILAPPISHPAAPTRAFPDPALSVPIPRSALALASGCALCAPPTPCAVPIPCEISPARPPHSGAVRAREGPAEGDGREETKTGRRQEWRHGGGAVILP